MTLEPLERRIHLCERRCQIARFALVETALVAKLNAHAVQVTPPMTHPGRPGAGPGARSREVSTDSRALMATVRVPVAVWGSRCGKCASWGSRPTQRSWPEIVVDGMRFIAFDDSGDGRTWDTRVLTD